MLDIAHGEAKFFTQCAKTFSRGQHGGPSQESLGMIPKAGRSPVANRAKTSRANFVTNSERAFWLVKPAAKAPQHFEGCEFCPPSHLEDSLCLFGFRNKPRGANPGNHDKPPQGFPVTRPASPLFSSPSNLSFERLNVSLKVG